jgi:phosphopantothenoylcysteine decarboxylase/phosphopantothenate--cysteine ligase
MARIVITSGPTRQYLDPVRYLTNASSGRMGSALVQAALDSGHEVIVVSGPVSVPYPSGATVLPVLTTTEMLEITSREFELADGLIGAAAPCDYMPERVETHKLNKTGQGLHLHLIETPDIVATLGARKRPGQWVVGFALETEDVRFRAIVKMSRKSCDMIVSNQATAMNADTNSVEVLLKGGELLKQIDGPKSMVAREILQLIDTHLILPKRELP